MLLLVITDVYFNLVTCGDNTFLAAGGFILCNTTSEDWDKVAFCQCYIREEMTGQDSVEIFQTFLCQKSKKHACQRYISLYQFTHSYFAFKYPNGSYLAYTKVEMTAPPAVS